MKKLSVIILILISIAYAGFFKRQEVVEIKGRTCDIMTKNIAGYNIAIGVAVDKPYELMWMAVRNPEGCTSILRAVEHKYEKD